MHASCLYNTSTYWSTFRFSNGEVHNLIDVTSQFYFYQKDNLSGTFEIQYKKFDILNTGV